MKISGLLILLTLGFSTLNAQSGKEEVDFIQSLFGMEKKALVAEFVKPEAAQKDAFWELYDAYATARKELGKKRIELLVRIIMTISPMSLPGTCRRKFCRWQRRTINCWHPM